MKNRFNYITHIYSEKRRPKSEYPKKLAEHLLSLINCKNKNLILDIGCGRGDFLRVFSDLGHNVIGVDIAKDVKRYCDPHKVIICDLDKKKIPLEDSSVDIIFTKSCIEHLYYPLNLIQEANRVLKKNGYLIILTPSWVHHKFGPFYLDFTHRTPFTMPSLKDILQIGGFNTLTTKHFYQLPFLWKFPFLLIFVKIFSLIPLPYKPMNEYSLTPFINKFIRFSKEAMLLAVAQK